VKRSVSVVSFLASLAWLLALVSGCSRPQSPDSRIQTLQAFPVLDEVGNEAPALEPSTDRSPFGVLAHFPLSETKPVGYCTATHLAPGKVTTNSHCVTGSDPTEYFFIFYDASKKKKVVPAQAFAYRGSLRMDDIAILDLNPTDVADWDVAPGFFWNTGKEIGVRPPKPIQVTLWAYDPIVEHRDLMQLHGAKGMVFSPRHCQASRTVPKLTGITKAGKEANLPPDLIEGGFYREKVHAFLDGCDHFPVRGNSGSLVTLTKDFRRRIGLFHWMVFVSEEARREFSSFEYTGNDGRKYQVPALAKPVPFFAVTSTFDLLLQEFPDIFE
jgi:hypothetical protein